ncbi:MAG TPA: tRNA preQ1(34) S-adenosylmethionine ribosyltransferase-isomerase QueA [Candidatus Atribacteria bacterium]|nr:tRNA preQ1(34) S-adenosylmethionine ribosyltransferase-isomerase QueA [Candidatus Atribacteria bacterium]HPT79402.1 tRNA preQ1(34) S-adenosylmethionine ribosyltransferase-isomerase QueA [Candidatus Atribacteria bacterium]
MKVSDFDYSLPEELIAQRPIDKRDESRLLVYNRADGSIEHRVFKDIVDYLDKGDCLVLNDTKVIPARLLGKKEDTGGSMEFVLLSRQEDDVWRVLVKPGKRAQIGTRFIFADGLLKAEVLAKTEEGGRLVRFHYDGVFEEVLDKAGIMPLPPYIHEELKDRDRYQTVYAQHSGSAAAPTAGLHFTPDLLRRIEESGVRIAKVTLHVGIGTFRPVKTENLEDHHMHEEVYNVDAKAADIINRTRDAGGRVIAVGTTSLRTIESIADETGHVKPGSGSTGIFIYPGYKFKVTDALITNFHLPKSTLLMLVSALAGREEILRVYREAIEKRYRFFSFGDAMFIY